MIKGAIWAMTERVEVVVVGVVGGSTVKCGQEVMKKYF